MANAAPDFKGVYTSVEQLNAVTGMTVNDCLRHLYQDSDGNTTTDPLSPTSGSAWVLRFLLPASNALQHRLKWTAINSGITSVG